MSLTNYYFMQMYKKKQIKNSFFIKKDFLYRIL